LAGEQENGDKEADSGLNSEIVNHVLEHGDDLFFTNQFWKGCEPNKYDLQRFSEYVSVISLHSQGIGSKEVSRRTGVLSTSIWAWTTFKQKPKLAHYLSEFLRRGSPGPGRVWLSINNSSRFAVPYGPFVAVPTTVTSWKDVESVLSQITPLGNEGCGFSKEYMFGFLLGIMIGDAAKKRQGKWHRLLELVLSRRYDTSLKIGDFTCLCAQSIGVRMQKAQDIEPYGIKPRGFFVWRSQSSALVDWMFNACLGLKDGELTTYTPVRMAWAVEGPVDFRRGLIQGLAESDGSVNLSGQEVELWIGPSWDFGRSLLESFGIRAFRSREALTISKSQVSKALGVPIFASHLHTVRCQRFEKLAKAKHVCRGKRLPAEVRYRIRSLAHGPDSVPTISERILDEFGVIPTYETVQRWVARERNDRARQTPAESNKLQ
jgi:hypothetical protein